MNDQLKLYCQEVQDVEAPPAEMLHTLYRRDGLDALVLADDERQALHEADQMLLRHVGAFAVCTDFIAQRRERNIPPERWWWYLDAIAHAPRLAPPRSVASSMR